jgi:purine-binding chemotaxis protein CheW
MAAGRVQAAPATPAKPAMSRGALALIGLQVGGRDYAIRLDEVAEIMRLPKDWGTLPRMDESVLGVIGFRGGVLPLVGLAMLLGLEAAARPTRGIILIVRLAGAWIGLVADSVSTRFTLALDAIDPVPRLLTRAAGQAQLEGICRLEGGRKLVGLLAISRLFDPHLLAWLEDTAAAPMSQVAKPAAEAASEQVLLFDIGGVSYGLPIAAVDEVAPCPDRLARPPHVPDFILGVLSLRGRTVTVIDMARRLGAAPSPSRGRRVIVVSADGRQAGLAVDTVSGVRAVDEAALRPAPDVIPGTHAAFDRVALQQEGRMMLLVSAAFVVAQAARDLSAAFSGRAKASQPATP